MGLSATWTESLVIITLQIVKKLLGINPMGLIAPGDNYPEIIALYPVSKNC